VRDIRRRIEGGDDFAEMAKEFSEDTATANLGGDMGWFEIGAYGTRVEQVLNGLADGQLSEPFQTEVGWHLMQRLSTREADVTDERRREQARDIVRNRKAEEEYDLFLRQLRGEAYIENRLTDKAESTDDSTTTG